MIKKIKFHEIKCTCCGNTDCFIFYGKYSRSNPYTPDKKIKIQRIQCNCCKINHAIIPSCLIPYTKLTFEDTVIAYHIIASNDSFNSEILSAHPTISLQDIYYLKKSFHIWEKVIAGFSTISEESMFHIFKSSFELTHRNISQCRFRRYDLFLCAF